MTTYHLFPESGPEVVVGVATGAVAVAELDDSGTGPEGAGDEEGVGANSIWGVSESATYGFRPVVSRASRWVSNVLGYSSESMVLPMLMTDEAGEGGTEATGARLLAAAVIASVATSARSALARSQAGPV